MCSIFSLVFRQLHSSNSVSVGCRLYLFELLKTLIDETDEIPEEISSLVWNLFSTESLADSASYKLLVDLLCACGSKFQASIGQKFSSLCNDRKSGYSSIRALHVVASRILASSPEASVSLLLQISKHLKSEDPEIRQIAILAISLAISKASKRTDFLEWLWQVWIDRRADVVPSVRVFWSKTLVAILQNELVRSAFKASVENILVEKLQDLDESVRERTFAAIDVVVGSIESYPLLLNEILNRARDVSSKVRSGSLETLGRYLNSLVGSSGLAQNAISVFAKRHSSFLNSIFCLLYTNDKHARLKHNSHGTLGYNMSIFSTATFFLYPSTKTSQRRKR